MTCCDPFVVWWTAPALSIGVSSHLDFPVLLIIVVAWLHIVNPQACGLARQVDVADHLALHLCARSVFVLVQLQVCCQLWRCHLGHDGYLGRLIQHGSSCDLLVFLVFVFPSFQCWEQDFRDRCSSFFWRWIAVLQRCVPECAQPPISPSARHAWYKKKTTN